MDWLKRLLGRPSPSAASTEAEGFPAPWADGRPSIFRYLGAFPLDSEERLPDDASLLPDDDSLSRRSGSKLRWAPGALDGVLGHHSDNAGTSVAQALRVLEAAVTTRSPTHVKDFYDLANDHEMLRIVDPLLEEVRNSAAIDAESLRDFGRWLARESPERGPVKTGIALLGLFQPQCDTEMLMRLGLHDEFTLYAAVALANTLPDDEQEDVLWSLARRVDGWGRVQVVERLAKRTSRADIKDWLLRDGYKNSVMYEYLAYACASGGGLASALCPESVDPELLDGAGDLIRALLPDGPARDITSYEDGAQVVSHYLRHTAKRRSPPLDAYLAVSDIASFVNDTTIDWEALTALGWTAHQRLQVSAAGAAILGAPQWQSAALSALESKDATVFWTGSTAAERMGLDIWEKRYERQRDGPGEQWFDLMRTCNAARIDRIVALASKQLDLRSIGTGPADELGLGADFRQHSALDFILQGLGEFSGKGWSLVEAGIRSPVTRNRNMALKVLAAWDRACWPEAAAALLSTAHDAEPVDELRARMGKLLDA